LWLCQQLLEHEGVDVDHAVLYQMKSQHADLVVFSYVTHEFPSAGKSNKIRSSVPLFNHIQSPVNFPPQLFTMEITAEEDFLVALPSSENAE
jgi:hypothetical protein